MSRRLTGSSSLCDGRISPEGVRIKHMVEENSIKMYDKQGCVLRIETTINNPRRWNVWRRATRKGKRAGADSFGTICHAAEPPRRGRCAPEVQYVVAAGKAGATYCAFSLTPIRHGL